MKDFGIIAVSLLGFGLLLIIVGLLLFVRARRFASRADRRSGVLLRYETQQMNTESGLLYAPVVEYIDGQGAKVTSTARVASNYRPAKPGQPVILLIDPSDPTNFRIAGFSGQYAFSLILASVGIIFSLVGALFCAITFL